MCKCVIYSSSLYPLAVIHMNFSLFNAEYCAQHALKQSRVHEFIWTFFSGVFCRRWCCWWWCCLLAVCCLMQQNVIVDRQHRYNINNTIVFVVSPLCLSAHENLEIWVLHVGYANLQTRTHTHNKFVAKLNVANWWQCTNQMCSYQEAELRLNETNDSK